jgi:phosphoglucosamine mutase
VGGAFSGAGGEVHWAGVLPTPAVSHLLRDRGGFGAGVVVSASHNPAADNGVKLVGSAGSKLPVQDEVRLEEELASMAPVVPVLPLPQPEGSWRLRYLDLLLASLPRRPLAGIHLVVDAANGAAAPVAREFFTALGAEVLLIHAEPDGTNINERCGALFPEILAREVRSAHADAGAALDGDADRAILVTGTGRVLDGDDGLLVWARALAGAGRLPHRKVVATVMSNLGLEVALKRDEITLVRCPVGDREVWETMQREGAVLGGEQSGHLICSHHAVARRSGRTIEALADLERFPQVLLNVRVAARRPVEEVPQFAEAVRAAEARLAGNGRVFVRYSGTEPLLRIMVEAAGEAQARETAEQLAALAHEHLGVA